MLRHLHVIVATAHLALAGAAASQTLVGHWPLDDAAGTQVRDLSSSGMHGMIVGNPIWAQGQLGGGLEFRGFGGDVSIPWNAAQDVATLTIACWIKLNNYGDWDGILTKGRTVSPYALQGGFPLGRFKFTLNWGSPTGSAGYGSFISSSDLPLNTWTHIAASFDGSDVKLYVDGFVDAIYPAGAIVLGTTQEGVTFGADYPGGLEHLDGVVDDVRLYDGALSDLAVAALAASSIGTSYCGPAALNSTGARGRMSAGGSRLVAANDVSLFATQLSPNSFGFFLTSRTAGFVANPGGSTGNLCLGGSIGRFVGPGAVVSSGPGGAIQRSVSLLAHPTPTGPVAVTPGERWHYQLWHRDFLAGAVTSNFTDGVRIDYQ